MQDIVYMTARTRLQAPKCTYNQINTTPFLLWLCWDVFDDIWKQSPVVLNWNNQRGQWLDSERSALLPSGVSIYLVHNFAKGLLKFTMNSGQLLGIPISFMNRDEHLVDFIHGLVHASLQTRGKNKVTYLTIRKTELTQQGIKNTGWLTSKEVHHDLYQCII